MAESGPVMGMIFELAPRISFRMLLACVTITAAKTGGETSGQSSQQALMEAFKTSTHLPDEHTAVAIRMLTSPESRAIRIRTF